MKLAASIVFCFFLTLASMAQDAEQVVQALNQRATQVKGMPLRLEYSVTSKRYYDVENMGERLPGGKVVIRNPNFVVGDGRTTRPNEKIVDRAEESGLPYEETRSHCVLYTSGTAYALEKSYIVEVSAIHPFNRETSSSRSTKRTIKIAYDGVDTRMLVESHDLTSDRRTLRGETNEGDQDSGWLRDLFMPHMAYQVFGKLNVLSLKTEVKETVLEIGSHTRFRLNPLENYMLISMEYPNHTLKLDGIAHVNGVGLPVRFSRSTTKNGKLRSEVESGDITYRIASPEEFSRAIALEFPPETQIVESAMGRQLIQPY